MEGEETCLAVIGISVLTVGLYLQVMNRVRIYSS